MSNKKSKEKQKSKSGSRPLLKGALDITRSGMGYVVMSEGRGDVLVRPGDFNTALHGDTVRVKVVKESSITGRKEGKIMEVIKRKQTEFMGVLQMSARYAFFVSDSDKPMPDIYIPSENLNHAKDKDHVIVKLVQWEKTDKKPVGEVINVLKPEDINDRAMKDLIASNGFPLSFDEQVLNEAKQLPDIISEDELKRRKDFRDVLSFTIDPVDAKDFDDAISFRSLKNGVVRNRCAYCGCKPLCAN